jgi:hypothetical protein
VVTVHGLTEASHGNAAGLGLADVAPLRLLDQLDVAATYLNSITAGTGGLRRSRMPMLLPDDASVVRAAIAMCGRKDPAAVRLARVHDTAHPDHLLVSQAVLTEVDRRPELSITTDFRPLLTAAGTLTPWPDDEVVL